MCISDDEELAEYHPIGSEIPATSYMEAFERIRELIFEADAEVTRQEFRAARDVYRETNGFRLAVRQMTDPHYEVPDGTDCTSDPMAQQYPGHCVGRTLSSTIARNFEQGVKRAPSEIRRVYAARIRASFLWFFYVATYKAAVDCTTDPTSCDKAFGYFTGGRNRRATCIGFEEELLVGDPAAHLAAWHGLLALRCWRDVDDGPVAKNLAMRDCALRLYDHALLDGMASFVRGYFNWSAETTGATREYAFVFARTLAPVLLRAMEERSPEDAQVLRTALARESGDAIDTTAVAEAIDRVFRSPRPEL
jgi:hypothetical protein